VGVHAHPAPHQAPVVGGEPVDDQLGAVPDLQRQPLQGWIHLNLKEVGHPGLRREKTVKYFQRFLTAQPSELCFHKISVNPGTDSSFGMSRS